MGGMAHDAAYWDDRYAASGGDKHEHRLSGGPDPSVVEITSGLPPGRALDVAAGSGRHALWLAARGWAVTAVDFSGVGLAAGRALDPRAEVEWVVADVTTWTPPLGASYDVILCAFFHLDADVYPRVRAWLAPGGRLVVIGHALRNLTDGVGGPSNPAYLHTEDQLRAAATGLEIERLGEVVRPVGDRVGQGLGQAAGEGPADAAADACQIDLVLVARRPA
jgi:SAM-dependent methyltransferase